jgi:two-component system sensor histidine kinase AtoS
MKSLPLKEGAEIDKGYWGNFCKTAEKDIEKVKELVSELSLMTTLSGYHFKEVNVTEFMRARKEVFESLVEGKDIELQFDILATLPSVSLDREKIEQTLLNAVLNAVQAISDKGSIKIGVKELKENGQNDYIGITISDTGVGISGENMNRVFDPFFTTKGPQTRGLGLTISNFIVKQHSGDIDIVSEEKKGTTVTIRLPLNPNMPQITS